MVYCGKLSTACERCRKRRIKCDERQPQCSQCLRAQEPCSGYRNVRLLSFRDQNEEVIRKVHSRSASSGVSKKAAGKGRVSATPPAPLPPLPAPATLSSPATALSPASTTIPASEDADADADADGDNVEQVLSDTALMNTLTVANAYANTGIFPGEPSLWTGYEELQRQLSPSISEVGRSFFWNNYVLDDIRSAQGWLGYLSPTEGSMYENPAVMMVIEAIGLASVANMQRVPALMATARKQYAEAVSWTNVMLSSLNDSISDSTLAAVILLGMFEVITGTGTNSVHSWRNHIKGATKLIELRGVNQLCSPLGLQMFTQLRTQIVINNIYWETNTSPLIAELSACAENLRSSDDTHIDRLANIIIRLGSFCTAAKKASSLMSSDPATVILQGMAIDTNLVSWANSLPDGWAYTTERPDQGSLYAKPGVLLPGEEYYHNYPSMWIATAWNNYRSGRIIVNEVILDQLAELRRRSPNAAATEENARLEAQSRKILAEMVNDICAGALYHIGACLLDDDNQNTSSNSNNIHSPSAIQMNVAAGGYLLMWPAFLAAACSYTHTKAHLWLTQCLEKIGYRMGIHQALAMVALLRRGLDSRVWLRHELQNMNLSM